MDETTEQQIDGPIILQFHDAILDDWEKGAEFVELIQAAPSESTLHLWINCNGGMIDIAWQVACAIMAHDGPVLGLVTGPCYSAANIVLAACDKRYVMPNSVLLLHPVRVSRASNSTAMDFQMVEKTLRLSDESMTQFIAHRCDMTEDSVRRCTSVETALSAQEAVGAGFAEWLDIDDFGVALRVYTEQMTGRTSR